MAEEIVTGFAGLAEALDQLPAKLEKNIMRGALRAGAKVQLTEVRRDVPVEHGGEHPGALRDSARITTSARNGVVKASVKVGGKSAFYARFVALGTKPHLIKPKAARSLFFAGLMRETVNHPGARANNFMMRALVSTAQRAVDAVAGYIRARLTKQGIDVPDPGA